jgi:hypothetical protein
MQRRRLGGFAGAAGTTTNIVTAALPASKEQCKNGLWRDFGVFKNQGDCVGFVATSGRNAPANNEPSASQ